MAGVGERAQEDSSRLAIAAVSEFLEAEQHNNDSWTFGFGAQLVANWGGVYGGAVAASVLTAARGIAPTRAPGSLHIQFIRSVQPGTANI